MPRKGDGFMKTLLNRLTRRKQIQQEGMRPAALSAANQTRKQTLEAKRRLTQPERKELSLLQGKLAPPERTYKAQQEEALEQRTKTQKFFDRFYKPQNKPVPQAVLRVGIEGIADVYDNTRKPFSKAHAKRANQTLPEPPESISPEGRTINGVHVPLTSQIQVEYLNLPLLYAMWRQEPPRASLEEISDEEFAAFAAAIQDAQSRGAENDDIARDLFHMEGGEEAMDEWILEHEQGRGYNSGNYRFADIPVRQPDGSRRLKRMILVPGGIRFGRYLSRILGGKKMILRSVEVNDHTCTGLSENNTPDQFTPLTTLKSNGCLTIWNSERFDDIGSEIVRGGPKQYDPSMLRKNWLILPPEFYPLANGTFVPIQAKFFPTATYIQEALENWAVQGIDLALWDLLQMKYPQYAMKIGSHIISSKDFDFQERALKPFDNFILVDQSILPEPIAFTALNPFGPTSRFAPLLQAAAAQQKLYGFSPYVAYAMKKLALPLWQQAFPSIPAQKNYQVYQGLSEQEKITIDFLQSLYFKDRLLGSDHDYQQARDIYNDLLGQGDARRGLIAKLANLYMLEYPENSKHLAVFQKAVTKEYLGERFEAKTTKGDIFRVLAKFVERDSSGLSAGPPPPPLPGLFASPRLNLTNLGGEPEFEPLPAVAEPLPHEIVWGNTRTPVRRPPPSAPVVRGAFNASRNVSAEQRRVLKRIFEINEFLSRGQVQYNTLVPRKNNLAGRSRFLQTKKRYGRLAAPELQNLKNAEFLEQFPLLKTRAEEELVRLKDLLRRIGYPPLPASNSENE